MITNWISSALAAGFGAFAGAMTAYFLALRKERSLKKEQYLCLLLLIHEHLEPLYLLFSDIDDTDIQELNDTRVVVFDMPLPDLEISTEQMQLLFEVSPDKQMPSTLIQVQHFLKAHSRRLEISGENILSLDFVRQQAKQLGFMLLSVRVQYEQATNDVFPLDS